MARAPQGFPKAPLYCNSLAHLSAISVDPDAAASFERYASTRHGLATTPITYRNFLKRGHLLVADDIQRALSVDAAPQDFPEAIKQGNSGWAETNRVSGGEGRGETLGAWIFAVADGQRDFMQEHYMGRASRCLCTPRCRSLQNRSNTTERMTGAPTSQLR